MNPIDENLKTGTLGELLVQARLLQYDVQAAPPIKDSGNDLIAVHGDAFRSIQVKTTTTGRFNLSGLKNRRYHIVAFVALAGEDREIYLDRSRIYLMEAADVTRVTFDRNALEPFEISQEWVNHLFAV